MKVKSESEVAQLCTTLRDPMDCSQPGSSVQGIFQARVLEWGAIVLGWREANSSCGFLMSPVLGKEVALGAMWKCSRAGGREGNEV